MEPQACGGLAGGSSQAPTKSQGERKRPDWGLSGGGKFQDLSDFHQVTSLEVGAPSPPNKVKGMLSKGSMRNSVASPFAMLLKTGERVPLASDSLEG